MEAPPATADATAEPPPPDNATKPPPPNAPPPKPKRVVRSQQPDDGDQGSRRQPVQSFFPTSEYASPPSTYGRRSQDN